MFIYQTLLFNLQKGHLIAKLLMYIIVIYFILIIIYGFPYKQGLSFRKLIPFEIDENLVIWVTPVGVKLVLCCNKGKWIRRGGKEGRGLREIVTKNWFSESWYLVQSCLWLYWCLNNFVGSTYHKLLLLLLIVSLG